jgi:hypothetical protein
MTYPAFDGTQLCAQIDPEQFFPETEKAQTLYEIKATKAVCNNCHFKTACLEYALQWEVTGIWGGTLEVERRRLAKARGISRKRVLPQELLPNIGPARDGSEEDAKRERERIYANKRYHAKKQARLANTGAA